MFFLERWCIQSINSDWLLYPAQSIDLSDFASGELPRQTKHTIARIAGSSFSHSRFKSTTYGSGEGNDEPAVVVTCGAVDEKLNTRGAARSGMAFILGNLRFLGGIRVVSGWRVRPLSSLKNSDLPLNGAL